MKDSHKILAACFSCTGQARKLAGAIAAVTGGSLAEIRPAAASGRRQRRYPTVGGELGLL